MFTVYISNCKLCFVHHFNLFDIQIQHFGIIPCTIVVDTAKLCGESLYNQVCDRKKKNHQCNWNSINCSNKTMGPQYLLRYINTAPCTDIIILKDREYWILQVSHFNYQRYMQMTLDAHHARPAQVIRASFNQAVQSNATASYHQGNCRRLH